MNKQIDAIRIIGKGLKYEANTRTQVKSAGQALLDIVDELKAEDVCIFDEEQKDRSYLSVETWRRDAAKYADAGNKCELWGRKVPDMTRDDLIAFIGFLDELASMRFGTKII